MARSSEAGGGFWGGEWTSKSSLRRSRGRGTAPVGRGGGAAPSRHCPSVSASRCHLPIASRQGGFKYSAQRPQRPQREGGSSLRSLRESYSKPPTRPCQDRKSTRLNSSH